MTHKTRKIIGWILTGILAFVFISSAVMKLRGGEEAAAGAASLGLTGNSIRIIAMVELISILLFIIPRTGVIGTLLLAAYVGGAIATHLEHQQPFLVPVIIEALVWITALIRYPELGNVLFGKKAIA